METNLFLTFLAAAIGLTFMPGPDNLFVLSESLLRGTKRGVGLSAGLASGNIVHTALAASGLALLMQSQAWLFSLILTLGAGYLFYLAWSTFKEAPPSLNSIEVGQKNSTLSFWSSFQKGFTMNVLNPKVTLFFLALLPQFVSADASWSAWQQMVVMGFTFILQTFIIFSGIALLAGRLAQELKSATFQQFSRWFQILLLAALAFGLLYSAWF